MTSIKIIKKQERIEEDNNDNDNFALDYKEMLSKMFIMCKKIIDLSSYVIEEISLQEIKKINDDDFYKKYHQLEKTIDFFSLIFGKKCSVVEALAKATKIMNDIQKIANKLDINLVVNEKNEQNCEIWDEQDVEIMKQIVDDIGAEKFKEDITECYNMQLKEQEEKKKKENKQSEKIINTYEAFESQDT